jgi:glucokinase
MSNLQNLDQYNNKVWAGVDIGGTKTAVVLCSATPEILARVEFPTLPAQGPDRALNLIKQAIHELVQTNGILPDQLAAIGVSCGGPLDRKSGVIQAPPNLATWVDVPITSILQAEFGVPCRLENDANAGAVAEHRFGAGKGTEHMVFLTMGTGMGAGIIANGRLYHGASDLAGEIGHVRLTSTGPIGHNKAGSVEGWVSGGGLAEVACGEVAAAARKGESTALFEKFSSGTLTAKDVALAARDGDELSNKIMHDTGIRLGRALAIVVDVLNPQRIVIGGLAMRLGETLLGPACSELCKEALSASVSDCQIVPSELGEQIGDIAAFCVARGFV